MVKFGYRIMAIILLGTGFTMVYAGDRMLEYSSMGIYTSQEDIGEIVLFVLYVVVNEIGKVLDKKAICPVYCQVNHEHIYEKTKSNLQTADRIPRSGKLEDREQPESSLRFGPDNRRLCRNAR